MINSLEFHATCCFSTYPNQFIFSLQRFPRLVCGIQCSEYEFDKRIKEIQEHFKLKEIFDMKVPLKAYVISFKWVQLHNY